LFVYLGIIKVMSNIKLSRMNQEALEAIKPEQFICFKYKHPVLENRDAMFTYEKCLSRDGDEYAKVHRLGDYMLVDYIKDGILKVSMSDMMAQHTTYQFDLSKIEILGYTYNNESYKGMGVIEA